MKDAVWRRSSYSGTNGNCLEYARIDVAYMEKCFAIRDSKDPNGGMLLVGESSWRRFIATASRDGFAR